MLAQLVDKLAFKLSFIRTQACKPVFLNQIWISVSSLFGRDGTSREAADWAATSFVDVKTSTVCWVCPQIPQTTSCQLCEPE